MDRAGVSDRGWRSAIAVSALLVFAGSPLGHGATGSADAPCSGPEYRQFDFWLGNWQVFDGDRPDHEVARTRVERILNGCVLHEVYTGADGYEGESFSAYDATRRRWHQSWVTNHGQWLTIEGGLRGGMMDLSGSDVSPDGKPRKVRGHWQPVAQGVRETAVRSTDGGATWVPWFDLIFRANRP